MKAKAFFSGAAGIAAVVVGVTAGLVTGAARPARAEILAGYIQGHGGLSSPETSSASAATSGNASPGLGVQAGIRLFIFEAYADHTSMTAGSSTSRGILGLRAGIGLGNWRLVLRGGGGVIAEHGGALTGRVDGAPDRTGVAARAGVALERKLAPMLLGGVGLDGEAFDLITGGTDPGTEKQITGSDVFLSLHLKFEIGI
jgi:hypothetical protein